MLECRRYSGAYDFGLLISECESRNSEGRCRKTDLEIRWLSEVVTIRIKRMDCGMAFHVELFLLQDTWNNQSDNNFLIHRVLTNKLTMNAKQTKQART